MAPSAGRPSAAGHNAAPTTTSTIGTIAQRSASRRSGSSASAAASSSSAPASESSTPIPGPTETNTLLSERYAAIWRTAMPTSASAPAASAQRAQRHARSRHTTSTSTPATASTIQNAVASWKPLLEPSPAWALQCRQGRNRPPHARSSPSGAAREAIRAFNGALVSGASADETYKDYVSVTTPSRTLTRRFVPIASRNARSCETATIAPG